MTTKTVTVATRARREARPFWCSKWFARVAITLLALVILFLFLVPFAQMLFVATSTPEQMAQTGAPIYPARSQTFEYQGKKVDVYAVPMPDGTTRNLALVKPGREQSTFVDPANPGAGEIVWKGRWRTLTRPWTFSPSWTNFTQAWKEINFPRLFFNTLALAVIGIIGTLVSCTLVAYGFSRFRFPGRNVLFIVLISTMFLPAAVTIVPTYTFFVKVGWVGTWLPLLVPHFFANAYNVFLLRQYFMTIPRDLDEAATIDGAGPMRVLLDVILPMSWPVIVAVTLFHLVWAWNDYFGPLIYLSAKPELQPIAVALGFFNGIWGSRPELIQAAAVLALLLPMVLFFVAQKMFIQGVVITGVEK